MLQQSRTVEVVVLRTIDQCAADSGARKWSIVYVLPLHREWRQVPVVTTGNASALSVSFLMAAGTAQTWNTLSFRTAHDIGDVPPSFIALLRIFSRSVTVDAARMSQH
jgi:hypothetical protein